MSMQHNAGETEYALKFAEQMMAARRVYLLKTRACSQYAPDGCNGCPVRVTIEDANGNSRSVCGYYEISKIVDAIHKKAVMQQKAAAVQPENTANV